MLTLDWWLDMFEADTQEPDRWCCGWCGETTTNPVRDEWLAGAEDGWLAGPCCPECQCKENVRTADTPYTFIELFEGVNL